ncbi:uncharacterized protein CC84DRAFT_1210508 [Paraphaeosphaeria sporulosa]|uniref:Zn(2)-C6 fungal-type domain-containing protein n=1 Tax=Paraphaeosphaeria sporulosa TaxID=1460663 RepID=A0A177BXE7_9PLEO|nr:uncharacterized protein CC84DRAFT_1210508 [Paraphaeosphaeria sporulosa]OAF99066.1 hypothetical protein CC84DRAFT_1210508 [Paraphaeosphaeria sporulosa]
MAAQAQGVPTGPTLPIVACLRCREQKLKCGREQPSCERCRKQDAACTYPPPPDRKRIAAEKNRSKASQSNNSSHTREHESSSSEANAAKRRRISHDTTGPFNCLAEPEAADLPSTEIGLLLQEVYYKRIYNAHLMFHKTVAFQVYMLNKTPDYLQRAIFAHGALFLQEVDPQYQKYVKAYPMQTLYERSWSWAHAASVQVLSHVDEPSVLKVQTLLILQQFYWARGEIVRAKVHATLAWRLSELLGYGKLCEMEEDPTLMNPSLVFDREIRRRSFWASWATMCLHSEEMHRIVESVYCLPLPATFGPGGSIQGVDLIHGKKLIDVWKLYESPIRDDPDDCKPSSLMAELMKLLGIWAQIRAWASIVDDGRWDSQAMQEIERIEKCLNQVEPYMQFPVGDIFAKAKSYDESPEFLVCVCSVYYISRIFLESHKMLVQSTRLQSLGAGPEFYVDAIGRIIAESMQFIRLLKQLLDNGQDITRLWHVTGYTAFIVGRIMAYLLGLQRSKSFNLMSPSQALEFRSEGTKTCQTVLEILSIYWKPLKSLLANLDAITKLADDGTHTGVSYPWEYINFLPDCEPKPDIGIREQAFNHNLLALSLQKSKPQFG